MKFPVRTLCPLAAVACIAIAAPLASGQVTFSFQYLDGAGEGFNDPRPATPVGLNTGTTLGEQRRQAFEFAAELWGGFLESGVRIVIEADFNSDIFCNEFNAILGFAGPNDFFKDFGGALLPDTWYASALANKLAGADQSPGFADLGVTMNGALDDNETCLGGMDWYYGFDGNTPAGTLDVVETILHELGHGLGFLSLVDPLSQFAFPESTPDAYSRLLFDIAIGASWDEMTRNQRESSAVNDPNVVWTGDAVMASLADFLEPVPGLAVTAPAALAGIVETEKGALGPQLPDEGVSGFLAIATDAVGDPSDACEPLVDFPAGSIALIDGAGGFIAEKVRNAQLAGATAVVFAGATAGELRAAAAHDPTLAIPAVGIDSEMSASLRAAIDNGEEVALTIAKQATEFVGTNQGFLRVYAPPVYEGGSSISHWTDDAAPDLLMEPFANDLELFSVDITVAALQDIGWSRSPFFTTNPDLVATELEPYTYTALVDDPDINDAVLIDEVLLPQWLNPIIRQPGRLTLSGTPGINQAGEYRVLLTAIDEFQNITTQDFMIVVEGDNDAPIFETAPITEADIDLPYIYNIVVSDADPGEVAAISAPRLPPWLFFEPTGNGEATLSGIPSESNIGVHPVTLRATDGSPMPVLQAFEITVSNQGPAIALIGAANITVECGANFNDPGATATDSVEGDVDVTAECTVDTSTPGEYVCQYFAEDSLGNESVAVRNVEVVDTRDPIVTLNGSSDVTIAEGSVFVDPGANAVDSCAGSLLVEIGGDTVDTDEPGVYIVTYAATDPAGNSREISRTVEVAANSPIAITVIGENPVLLECHEPFADPGATAVDNAEGALEVTAVCNVDLNTPGAYSCEYTARNSFGFTISAFRLVEVTDNAPPDISINGPEAINVPLGGDYTEPGATATDACEGALQVEIAGDIVDTAAEGEYIVTYTATDSSGNESIETRVVNVLDATAPMISLNGANPLTVECHDEFDDPGATATDAEDGPIGVSADCNVDTDTPGEYLCTYTATDSTGIATTVMRMITVEDTDGPVITLNGEAEITIQQGAVYNERGAIAIDACDNGVAVTIAGDEVDTSTTGEYIVEYTATDSAGNDSVETRTVIVDEQGGTGNGCASSPSGPSGARADFLLVLAAVLLLASTRPRVHGPRSFVALLFKRRDVSST